ncbi:unnamed protein product [Timema podura]|uniref:Uncharacterized protein n=1 Tax=Timema podura TaxID=61482 RepID=A0ABN7NIV0_TIMPD|nr:unnamed protein product [Timema podura]
MGAGHNNNKHNACLYIVLSINPQFDHRKLLDNERIRTKDPIRSIRRDMKANNLPSTATKFRPLEEWPQNEEFGQKTVSVMVDGREAELEIVDHPSSEMSWSMDRQQHPSQF